MKAILILAVSTLCSGQSTSTLTLQKSQDLAVWQDVPIDSSMLDANGKITIPNSGAAEFFRMSVTRSPSSSALAGFSLIPAGAFMMGNSVAEDTDITDASTRTVNVSAFYMAQNLVTKTEWDTVRAWGLSNGYTDIGTGFGKANNHPVVSIHWYDIVKWCNARSQKEGLTPVYYTNDSQAMIYKTGIFDVNNAQVKWSANGYRLPTEAEWEKAARGGLIGKRFPWGDTISISQANYYTYNDINYDLSGIVNGYHPSYATGVYPYTSPVGSFAANSYGLYDMAGNAWQWCWDWYGSYDTAELTNPHGGDSGTERANHGGGFSVTASGSRCASRGHMPPDNNFNHGGFRVARSSMP